MHGSCGSIKLPSTSDAQHKHRLNLIAKDKMSKRSRSSPSPGCLAWSWLVVATVLQSVALMRAQAEVCGVPRGGCVAPITSSSPPTGESEVVEDLQCRLNCIQQNDIDLEVIHDYPTWPSLRLSQLETNCGYFQKVQECHSGCVVRSKAPSLTINRCRDSCYSNCHDDACGGQTACHQSGSTCERKCRKTYCRFGCTLYDTLTRPDRDPTLLSSPIAPPTLTPTEPSWLYNVNVSSAMPSTLHGQEPPIVGYLFKVEVQGTAQVGFLWKTDLDSPLDLSGFACQHVAISFRVVSARNVSEFSPPAELCIGGVSGFPGQVEASSIAVHYSEDERPEFLGYAVANITWERPLGHEHLSSYDITLTSPGPDCGGIHTQHHFSGIGRNASSFLVMADTPNGLMKFGCSYILTVLAHPAQQGESGTHRSIAPSLSSDSVPELSLECTRLWEPQGQFNILATWTITNSSNLVEAIKRFSLFPTLRDTTKLGLFAVVERFKPQTVEAKEGLVQYSVLLNNSFLPQRDPELRHTIELKTERKEEFFWRRVPLMQSCTVPSSPLPPLPVTNITVTARQLTTEGSQAQLQLDLRWEPPAISYGELSQYELYIGEEAAIGGSVSLETDSLYTETFPATTESAVISTAFNLTRDTHCLFLQLRAYNEFLPGNWSKPLVLPLDSECGHTQSTDDDNELIKIYFEYGNGNVRVIEVECGQDVSPDTRLQSIEEKLAVVEDLQSSAQSQLFSIDQRIADIEAKLNALESMLSPHSHS